MHLLVVLSVSSLFQRKADTYESDMGRLHHKCNRLRLLATCSITITNKQNHNVIDYDYIESNRDHNCLETFSERKQKSFAWFDLIRQHTI